MKTCTLFGFISALSNAFVVMLLFFLGLHSDAAKLGTAKWVGGILSLAIVITCVVKGVKARRSEAPPEEDFGYGKALWAGLVITQVSSLLIAAFNLCYTRFINPAFNDIMVQDQISKLEASNMPADRLESAENMVRAMATPVPQLIFYIIFGAIFGLVISLIAAAFLKRMAVQPPRL
jgi:hypothetical protein